MISQLRPGMDLTRVTLPTFVLEPKSMLERITNFMSHPELLIRVPAAQDPEKRFVEIIRFYLSGFHILPPVCVPRELN
jgi:oxysterol-binding protein-related protein 8